MTPTLLRNTGIAQSAASSEALWPGWQAEALAFLKSFAETHETFISEEVTVAHEQSGKPQPPTGKSWGAVYVKAQKEGAITKDGYGCSVRRHHSPCPRWRSTSFSA